MLTLFPKYRIGLGLGWLATAVAIGFMVQSGAAWYWLVLVILLAGFAVLAMAELAATEENRRMLLILYKQGDPQTFLKLYAPLLQQPVTVPSRILTIRAYLSNAYLAMGEFDAALAMLADAPEVQGREAANARALLAGNRCQIYLVMKDQERAEEQLSILSGMAEDPKANPSLLADLPLLQIRLHALQGVEVDDLPLMEAARAAESPIRRADLFLALAEIRQQQGDSESAQAFLKEITGGNPDLYCVREGRKLAGLPALP